VHGVAAGGHVSAARGRGRQHAVEQLGAQVADGQGGPAAGLHHILHGARGLRAEVRHHRRRALHQRRQLIAGRADRVARRIRRVFHRRRHRVRGRGRRVRARPGRRVPHRESVLLVRRRQAVVVHLKRTKRPRETKPDDDLVMFRAVRTDERLHNPLSSRNGFQIKYNKNKPKKTVIFPIVVCIKVLFCNGARENERYRSER